MSSTTLLPVKAAAVADPVRAVRPLSAGIEIGRTDDPAEHEADRVAARLLRMPDPHATQCRCACGGSAGPGGECARCKSRRLALQRSTAPPTPCGAPAILDRVLSAAGRPLDTPSRTYFQPRLGVDLSTIRVHDDVEAADSASAVGALAYTVRNHIAFAEGRYSPTTEAGRRLIAHELTHVVQQGGVPGSRGNGGTVLQRFVSCTPARLSLRDCPPRERGELARAASSPMVALSVTSPDRGMVVVNFAVGSHAVKASLASSIYWQQFVAQMEQQSELRWEILGLSDCEGSKSANSELRRQRAEAIFRTLPPGAQRSVTRHVGASTDECMTGNDTEADRTMNRSVLIRRAEVGTVIEFDESDADVIEAERAKFVCGPDVTSEIASALGNVRGTFLGWSTSQREDACDALDSYPEGEYAWDIVELHNNKWIYEDYRPLCATAGATPPCGSTVQVADQCYTAGAPNYVVFGTMCKLCFDHYRAKSDLSGAYRFSLSSMRSLINLYKGKGVTGLGTPSGNFPQSLSWAEAGYAGWAGGTPTPGDRMNCKPLCPTKYSGPAFRVHWYPNLVLETVGR